MAIPAGDPSPTVPRFDIVHFSRIAIELNGKGMELAAGDWIGVEWSGAVAAHRFVMKAPMPIFGHISIAK